MGCAEPIAVRLPSPVEELSDDRLDRHGVRVWLKRDDLIHPEIPGNKWRKLSHNLAAATGEGHTTLLTFGGAYSNHVRATAAAGRLLGFRTVGVIRGEEHLPLNPVLSDAADQGMHLTYLDRTSYRHTAATLQEAPERVGVLDRLRAEHGPFYLLPEGGSNELAVRGCAELATELNQQVPVDVVCTAVGTGGTLAGIAAGLEAAQRALGFAVLKGGGFLAAEVERLQRAACGRRIGTWSIETEFHHGGYAKRPEVLDAFVDDFAARHGIRLDWVYVAKMMTGLYALVERGAFPPGTRIAALVTGVAHP